jgi:hypothetical protein
MPQRAGAKPHATCKYLQAVTRKSNKMPRYFFDVVNNSGTAHDHQGREFTCLDGAKRQGELIAIDLRFAPDAEGRTGDKVSVCDVRGTVLFSIPVPSEVEV